MEAKQGAVEHGGKIVGVREKWRNWQKRTRMKEEGLDTALQQLWEKKRGPVSMPA